MNNKNTLNSLLGGGEFAIISLYRFISFFQLILGGGDLVPGAKLTRLLLLPVDDFRLDVCSSMIMVNG